MLKAKKLLAEVGYPNGFDAGPFWCDSSYTDIDELYPQQANELDPKKREAVLHKMQQLVHEKAIYAPIWQLAFLSGVGPRVGDNAFGRIAGFPYTGPFEDLTIKA